MKWGEARKPATEYPDVRGERRWPMAVAVLSVGVLHAFLPEELTSLPDWVYQVVLVAFLLILIVRDPGRIDGDSPRLRAVSGVMIAGITVVNAGVAIRLVIDIVDDATIFDSAGELLLSGAIIWTTNVIAFALWFWDLDGGGAAARAAGTGPPAGFVFPEHNHEASVSAGWFPEFVDYLALSFNTAMAFSPTDVSAVRRWAKILMMAESSVSLVVAILVVSRAINILPN